VVNLGHCVWEINSRNQTFPKETLTIYIWNIATRINFASSLLRFGIGGRTLYRAQNNQPTSRVATSVLFACFRVGFFVRLHRGWPLHN
jgi:hypothetical protein